ncbi:MAG TPA: tetratricopeptide repeat protein [Terracidiphilus sp.]|nr:tetratricopeptide repeat protein [Terracidiphilus sp.]
MTIKLLPRLDLTPGFAAGLLFLLPLASASAQTSPATNPRANPAKIQSQPAGAPAKAATIETATADSGSKPASTPNAALPTGPNRAQAYYHLALASVYEDDAISDGRTDEVNQAIEQYKLALDADPNSAELSDDLADLYFRADRVHEAETTARTNLKAHPDDIDAHRLLGRIYLRQLGEGQNAGASTAASSTILDQAIAEFEKIIALQPRSVEDHMVLGQLYTVKHQPEKAESEFKTAQAIEPESEDVVLDLARLYADSGDMQHAVKAIEAVPLEGRTPKMEFTLGALYDQMKQPKDAIAAYKRADDLEPGDLQTMDALASALLSSDQLDQALKEYKALSEADPENAEALVHIGEIERRQGKYDDALATIRKARKIDPTSLDAGYNEGLLLDILGRFDDAVQTYQDMVDATSHANGAYKEDEKDRRTFFLERLAAVYLEQNKTDLAVATYQKMVDMGESYASRGYQGQVDAYRGAHEFDKATAISRKAVAANPQDRDLKLMLAGELVDQDHPDEGLDMAKALLEGATPDQQRAVWFALAQMNIRLRRWKDAEDALDKAEPLAIKKEDRTYLFFLRGEWSERQKHLDQAEQFFRQALNLDPDNAMTLNYLGYMWADKGVKLPEALKMIRQAVDLDPINGAYLDSLGWVYFKIGEYELAEDNMRQAVNRDQTDPTVHMHLGDLYEKTGRIRLAAAQWQLSLDEFAKSSPGDIEQGDVERVQKKLEGARVRMAKEDSTAVPAKPE